MALPTFVAAGTVFSGTGSGAPGLPSGWQAGDEHLLLVETADQALFRPAGWIEVPGSPVAVTNETRLTAFVRTAKTGDVAPTVTDPGDHILAVIIGIRDSSGKPHLITADSSGTASGADQTLTLTGGTTSVADCLVVACIAHGLDVSTAGFNTWTNADLSSFTERVDAATISGNGGGIGVATGGKATAGAFVDSTVVCSQTSPPWAGFHIAFRPTNIPANDNFANAELIPADPTTDLFPSSSYDATSETGEPLASTMDHTTWWEYAAVEKQILELRLANVVTPGRVIGSPHKGTAVNALTEYAAVNTHFGCEEQDGRGRESTTVLTFLDSATVKTRIQVDPSESLFVQVGRWLSTNAETDFDLEVNAPAAPTNDDFDFAEELVGASGAEQFDLRGATGDRWLTSQLTGLGSVYSSGDVFYRITTGPDPKALVFRLNQISGQETTSLVGLRAVAFEGDGLQELSWRGLTYGPGASLDTDYTDIQLEPFTTYYVAVFLTRASNGLSLTAYEGQLEWLLIDPPPNDDLADAEVLTATESGTNSVADLRGSTAEWDLITEENGEEYLVSNGIWFEFTPPTSGWYEFYFDYPGPAYYAFWHVFTGSSYPLTPVEGYTYNNVPARFALAGGDTYKIRFADGSWDGEVLNWSKVATPTATNDAFVDRITLTGASGTLAGEDLSGATPESGEPPGYFFWDAAGASLWYEWTAPADGLYAFWTDADDPATDFQLAVYTGSTVGALTFITAADLGINLDVSSEPRIAFQATSGVVYKIQVTTHGYAAADYGFDLHWDERVLAANDNFADAIAITGYAGSEIGNNVAFDPALEVGETDLAVLSGYAPYDEVGRSAWYKYEPGTTGGYDFTLGDSSFEGWFTILHGTTLATLTVVDWQGTDSPGTDPAYDHFSPPYAGNAGLAGTLTVDLEAGETYYILIQAQGSPGVPVDPEYTPDQMGAGDFELSWSLQPPANDNFADANNDGNIGNLNWFFNYDFGDPEDDNLYGIFMYPAGGCRQASLVGATEESGDGEPAILGFGPTRSVWFYLQPPVDGDYRIWIEPPSTGEAVADPLLAVYDWAPDISSLGAALVTDDDSGPGLYPEVILTGWLAYDAMYIQVDGRDDGDFVLKFQKVTASPPANDDFVDAITIVPGTGMITGTTEDSTVECDESPSANQWGGPTGSVWYTFMPTEDGAGIVRFEVPTTPPNHNYAMVDIYQGTTIATLESLISWDYNNGAYDEIIEVPFNFLAGIPVYIRVSVGEDDVADPFGLEVLVQSVIPPDNDDIEDAETIVSGGGSTVTSGNTDGSSAETEEPGDHGSQLPSTAGSVWYKYVAESPGMLAIWTTRPDISPSEWYVVNVWEGAVKPNLLAVFPYDRSPWRVNFSYGVAASYYEVREGETYWFQVIRTQYQSWGPFDLHVDEYLETIDWTQEVDGFTTTTGSPAISGGDMTCEAVIQYGTFDAGPSPKFAREYRIYFELENVDGQTLVRFSGDRFFFDPDDPVNMLGLFRIRDLDDTPVFSCHLYPGDNGENFLSFTNGGYGQDKLVPFSLGERTNDEVGFVSVELVFSAYNSQNADSTATQTWVVNAIVDGRPFGGSGTGLTSFTAKRPRYFDFGYWRYPNGNAFGSGVEEIENWETNFRRMSVTNKRKDYDLAVPDEYKITHFDGFGTGKSWFQDSNVHPNDGSYTTNVAIVPAAQTAYLPIVEAPWDEEQFAARSRFPTAGYFVPNFTYLQQACGGSKRWYGFKAQFDEWPASSQSFAGYGFGATGGGLAALLLTPSGELRITPYISPDFCVAHLQLGEAYWIEVHVDAEVMWDVKTTVYINGVSFGTFGSAKTWADKLAGSETSGNFPTEGQAYLTDSWMFYTFFKLGFPNTSPVAHDAYFSDIVLGTGNPDESAGPFKTITVGGAEGYDTETGVGEHYLPEWPPEYIDLPGHQNGGQFAYENAWRIHGWDTVDSGCFDETDAGGNLDYTSADSLPVIEAGLEAAASDDIRYFDWYPEGSAATGGPLGDQSLITCLASVDGGTFTIASDWDVPGPGDEPGFSGVSITGPAALQRIWGANVPWWASILGIGADARPRWTSASGNLHMEEIRIFSNPHVYPRFAYTDDFGATWTWIEPGEGELVDPDSADSIGDDVAVPSTGIGVYTDVTGALERLQVNKKKIIPQASAHPAYNRKFWYVEYDIPRDPTVNFVVHAANVWTRFKGIWGPPKPNDDTGAYSGLLRVHTALQTGETRRVGTFDNRNSVGTVRGQEEDDLGVVDRLMVRRAPDGTRMTEAMFNDMLVRFGYHEQLLASTDYSLACSSYAVQSDQRYGALLYAVQYELLVLDEMGPPPSGCVAPIDLSKLRFRSFEHGDV